MSELDIWGGEQQRPIGIPLPTVPRTNAERFDLEYENMLATGMLASRERNLFREIDRVADEARQAGLTDVPANWRRRGGWNSEGSYIGAPALESRGTLDAAEQGRLAWDEWVERIARGTGGMRGDLPGYMPPTSAEIQQRASQRAAATYREAEAARLVGGGGFGGLTGAIFGAFSDPVQLATLPIGAPARLLRIAELSAVTVGGRAAARIGATAAGEGAVAAAVQTGVEFRAAPYRVEIGLPDTFGENVAEAAIGGAVLGGGLRGLVEGWRAFRGRLPAPDAATARAEQDAASLAQEQIIADGYRPGGAEIHNAHAAAADSATVAVTAGMLPPQTTAPVRAPRVPVVDVNAGDAAATIAQYLSGPPVSVALRFGVVDDALAARIRQAAPELDIAGYEHVMQTDEMRHAWRRHGPDGQAVAIRPVTEQDLGSVGEWLATADRYEHQGYNRQGLPVLRAYKQLPDGTMVIIEEVRATRQRLAFKTMYFERGSETGGGPGTVGSRPEGPPLPPRPEREPGAAAQNLSPGLTRFNAFTPAGRPVLLEPQIVEIDSLVASHLRDGRPNPAFPHDEGVQPRDRGAAPSRDQVRKIAAEFIPDRLLPNREAGFGAPIVAGDQVVESGNGRVMALRSIFRNPQHEVQRQAYLTTLREAGYDVAGYRQPVLISRRISGLSPSERSAFVREANGRATLEAGAAETAARDAERMDAALPLWRGGDIDSAANADFVRRFLQDLTAEERGGFLTREGQLSAQGRARIAAALFARAYGDELGALLPRFLETSHAGFREVAGALQDVAGDWARMRSLAADGRIDPAADATADLAGAVRALDEARRKNLRVEDLVLQADFDRVPLTQGGLGFLAALHREPGVTGPLASRKAIRERLQGYIVEAEARQSGPDLFGMGPPPAGDAMAATARRVADDAPAPRAEDEAPPAPEDAAPTFSFEPEMRAPPPRPDAPPARADATEPPADATPPPVDPQLVLRERIVEASREAEATRAAKAVPDAELAEAQRIAAQADIPVPRLEGEAPGAIGARQLLEDADDAVKDAAEAAACMVGRAT
ncbi:hypothetical protein GXW78_26800 [Roseomonas terrae]|uniref:DdrB-like domain-containing protein n=1 Tax=Neoroseomonas terrae TaxID=424799 RepID=A0ABS5EQI2_9PROT|nr:hypothetical protein [Neoroseomonas terrae]MBR0653291.1 hypothetical protein [Neoroseomonas terrae]